MHVCAGVRVCVRVHVRVVYSCKGCACVHVRVYSILYMCMCVCVWVCVCVHVWTLEWMPGTVAFVNQADKKRGGKNNLREAYGGRRSSNTVVAGEREFSATA